MKMTISSVFLSILFASVVSAGPLSRRQNGQAQAKVMSPSKGPAVGAAYCEAAE